MAIDSPLQHWSDLATAADSGQLFLNPNAARDCNQACEEYLSILRVQKQKAAALGDVRGMGEFPSGIALAKKFSLKAVGGENNLVDVFQSHIDVVMAMQAVFRKFFDATETTDQDNASRIGQEGPR
ncbi:MULTISPECIES: hypothetical protein [unclassified Rhodococcus (in: high G+C Gram-positive bacteria)]|uniref:hypothetical protein n=1 Tax=unclassified Rhodococcus (in: high G+C Gram-positive bacteria) TaxID=192944 RepID=UPI0033972BD3